MFLSIAEAFDELYRSKHLTDVVQYIYIIDNIWTCLSSTQVLLL